MKRNTITLETPVDDLTFTVFDIETTGVRLESGDQMVKIGLLHYGGRRILDTYSPGDCTYAVEKARPLALLPEDRLLQLEDDAGKAKIIPLFDIVKIRPVPD